MKNQYFGDINDYRKYGILRCAAAAGWRVGVCWMLTADDGRPDGRKISYLSNPAGWQVHDAELFHVLASAVCRPDGRHVREAENESLLPSACFFGDLVPDKCAKRRSWFASAMDTLAAADLIFFDPDNGLEIPSKPYGSRNSSKYLYWDEIEESWRGKASLLVFQHFPREKKAQFTARMSSAFATRTPGSSVVAFTTSNVLFLLATRPEHSDRLRFFLSELQAKWAGQITPTYAASNKRGYYKLVIVAASRTTDIWLADDDGHLVQKEIGTLRTRLLPGHYTVEFGLGNPTYPIHLNKTSRYTQADLTASGPCPRPKIRLLPE